MDVENNSPQDDEQKFSLRDDLMEAIDKKREKDKDKKDKDNEKTDRKSIWEWLTSKLASKNLVEGQEATASIDEKPAWLDILNPLAQESSPAESSSALAAAESRTDSTTLPPEMPSITPEAPQEAALPSAEIPETPTVLPPAETAPVVEDTEAATDIIETDQPTNLPVAETIVEKPADEELIIAHQQAETAAPVAPAEQWYGSGYNPNVLRQEMERQNQQTAHKLRRERRLREDQARQTQKAIEQVAKNPDRPITAQPEVARVDNQPANEIIERVSKATTRPEQAPRPPEVQPEVSMAKPEQPPAVNERLSSHQIETSDTQLPPEAIELAVEKAAEQDKPIERQLEQSHEIKDTDRSTSSAVPLNTIVEETRQRLAQQASQLPVQPVADRPTLPPIVPATPPQKDELYNAAVRWGFWVAVAIIVLGLIAYLALR